MNPVIFAAVAISLLAVGTVSMSSLAAQQSTSNANVQKMALERDRNAEQANAYISAVSAESSSTKATIKNAGSSAVTVDHCLALSPFTSLRPTAAKVSVGQTFNPGASLDVVLSGTVAADDIKCVTSKGAVLLVKIDGSNGASNYSVTDDLAIYSVSAKVTPSGKVFANNASFKPPGVPSPNYSTSHAGSLVWSVPVVSQVTLTQVLRYDVNGNPTDISAGLAGTYAPNSQIQIPITSAVSKVAFKYANSEGMQDLTANVYPQTVVKSSGSASLSAGSSSVGAGQKCASTNNNSCQGAYLTVEKYVYVGKSYSPPTADQNEGH